MRIDRSKVIGLPAPDRVRVLGHRAYVGGHNPSKWYDIGKRQYHFLVAAGLRPHHRFLDIACGSLRLGQFLIPMLDKGHYFGLEAEPTLVEAGLETELMFDIAQIKQPVFGYGYGFDFSFCPGFDMAIAQSLFTHLTAEDIFRCLDQLRRIASADSQVFFTYHEGPERSEAIKSHANRSFRYPKSTIDQITRDAGWVPEFIGDWGHERGQLMVRAQIAT